ncbi:histidinol-phosphatase HisJ family protein [uncultured Selenomonas sp.]|uniref:histidinol-phosphatase HisJ family protein n=1 Tax=uncultured Selenomonas sp. TaxID=159275 RepID=UPI0026119858|nr:histidinol-phosphatase HisJ family protein [uncultured Selenomonas sp.]
MIFDSHMHTEVSADSAMKAADALERAAKLGVGAVFTEHEDMDFPGEKDFTFSPEDYWKKYEALRGEGERLRLGVELGMQEGLAEKNRAFVKKAPFDQVIGSIHTLLGFDLYYETLYEGREKDEVYRLYLRAMASCVRSHGAFIDILAHIDYIARYAAYRDAELTYAVYGEEIDEVLAALIETDTVLELNTRRFDAPQGKASLVPIFRRYRELGGREVTLGSDAHDACAVAFAFCEAQDLAESLGLRIVTFFARRKEYC